MADRLIYVSRLVRLSLVGADGAQIGQVSDVVLTGGAGTGPPGVNGFVVRVQKRHVFIGAGRIGEIETEGVRLRRGAINLRQFQLRPGEQLVVGELFGRRLRGSRIIDASIAPAPDEPHEWELATLALAGGGMPSRRKPPVIIGWEEAREVLRDERAGARQAAEIGHLHPVEMAEAIRKLPLSRRRVLADALEDERLADLLEELSEEEQVRIVEDLDLERTARVLDEMEADDAADLLGEFSAERRLELLSAMDPDEAAPVRRLLSFQPDTAGGLMTPEPIILEPTATVAEALARIRDPDLRAPLAAQVFVCLAPTETPTGRFLGVAHFQRLLREAPSKTLGRCVDDAPEPVAPECSDQMVAHRLAAYDVVALPVVDESGRLLGAVTIDDVLDRVLPAGWRVAGAGT
ncbi:MAG TPA: CBS domain-containing protein [Solirubrobacteraceae bacterium]|jgi:CBS domain-containing protein/sporulation protein YlmC with PRC-barrel domain|nr:CBS domain-containing protein [Solirubrobacteraceae bacterium]